MPDNMISVIVGTYNRAHRLRGALESMRRIHLPPDLTCELVVVDNNSTDGTESVVRDFQRVAPFAVRYVFETQQGHSRARNRGIAESSGEILAFTDDDVIVDTRWLEELWRTYNTVECLGVGGRIVPMWSCAKPAWLHEDGSYPLHKAIVSFDQGDWVCALKIPAFGANMSFRRAAFENYGLFRTDLGRRGTEIIGGEDIEFGRRLLRNNETLVYNPGVVIYHPVEEERTTKKYFARWYFAYGRAAIREDEAPASRRARLHRRMVSLRALAGGLIRWLTAVDPRRRLYYRLYVCEVLGRIRELCRRSTTLKDELIPRLRKPH
jgi:glucosyl-dolichyl phosphate glucuronosyltransferase